MQKARIEEIWLMEALTNPMERATPFPTRASIALQDSCSPTAFRVNLEIVIGFFSER